MAVGVPAYGLFDTGDGTSTTAPFPTGNVGDLVLFVVGTGESSGTLPTCSTPGFVQAASSDGGSGSYANNGGVRSVTVFSWEADSSVSGTVTATVGGSSTNRAIASFCIRIPKDAGDTWAPEFINTFNQTTASTSVSLSTPSTVGFTAGDYAIGLFVSAFDVPSLSSESVTAPGAAFGTQTEQVEDSTTSGFDVHLAAVDAQVGSGTATGPTTLSASASGSMTCGGMVIRLAVTTGSGTTAKSASDAGSATESVSVLLKATADASVASDVVLSMAVQVAASDFVFGPDTASLSAAQTASDTGHGAEASSPPTAALSAAEQSSGSEATSLGADVSSTDSSGSTDSGSVDSSAQRSSSDVSTSTEAVSLLVQITAADIGTALDAIAALAATATSSDTSGSNETAQVFSGNDVTDSDSATGTDSVVGQSGSAGSPDSVAVTETATVEAVVTSGDISSSVESAELDATMAHSEGATSAETASVSVVLSAADVVAVIDAVVAIVGPPIVRDWQELGATVTLNGSREASVRITRLEG